MDEKLTPYIVKLTKTVEQAVVIYAKNPYGLADIAQTMVEAGKIKLDESDPMIEALVDGEAKRTDALNFEQYVFSFERL